MPQSLLDESFRAEPPRRHSRHLPRRSDEHRIHSRTAPPPKHHLSYPTATGHDFDSVASRQPSPLASPGLLGPAESGLPPTPPTISHDRHSAQTLEPPPHADSVVNSLMSKKSSLSTPANARSPPTPDPSPPRTNASSPPSQPLSERPPMFAYPPSRPESFRTAREDLSSNPDSASESPVGDRLSTVQEDRGLGLAFEHQEDHATPTNGKGPYLDPAHDADTTAGAQEDYESPVQETLPDREWNTELMRNVTLRRKRKSKSSLRKDSTSSRHVNATSSPRKNTHSAVIVVETASPTPSTRTRPTSAQRERVDASHNSPVTRSIEDFAQSIGWPIESRDTARHTPRDASSKRMSISSTTSTMVEAMVIVTPPRRHQTLRHSGKNMAYRRDVSSPAEFGSDTHSNRNSLHLDDVPLHRLVHKRLSVTDRQKRISTDSGPLAYERPLGYERNMSPALSMRSTRTIDSSRHTLAHQESVRRVLQPAADILSRSSTVGRSQPSGISYHRRDTSVPGSVRRVLGTPGPRNFSQLSPPPQSPPMEEALFTDPHRQKRPVTPVLSPKPHLTTPASRKHDRNRRATSEARSPADTNKTLPNIRAQEKKKSIASDVVVPISAPVEEKRVPSGLMERVRRLVAEHEGTEESTLIPASSHFPASPEHLNDFSLQDLSPPMRRGSRSLRGRSGERRWSMHSQDRSSVSPDFPIRPSLDRISTEEMSRRSHEWRRRSVENGRVSFDLSAVHSEEHADARHLYAQGTPFSQMSDTLEVSEATAVSIYPHNNHSLLVVQQVPRSNSLLPDQPLLTSGAYPLSAEDPRDMQSTPTPPFVDANEELEEMYQQVPQPTLIFEPSTPPDLLQPDVVDTPLQNPRPPPEPPVIMFIPPTPAEELERELVPSPPKRSESHPQRQPQRRSNLVQRARRYSDNLITPLLARASINRRRHASKPNTDPHRIPRVPSVNDEDGTLHPFWRPRGFWDGFEDSDDESDGNDALPSGGDTSDIEDDEPPAPPRRTSTLGRKLTNGLRGSGGFLIGNSLGVERHGTNKRRHHITLPPHFPKSPRTLNDPSSPKVLAKSPTRPLGGRGGGGISRRRSSNSLRSNMSYETPGRRASWRQGRSLPGIRKYQVQYIGLTGVKENFKERRAEKRRNKLRKSIGSRFYVEPVGSMST